MHRLVAITSLCAAASCVVGQTTDGGERPKLAGRVVRVFDFEERATNPGEVPRDWYRGQDNRAAERREGFPAWNKAMLTYRDEGGQAWRGEGAVLLPTSGGATSLVLGPGVVPIFPDAEYEVTARVRTQNLSSARATVLARVLDNVGKPIPGGEARSEPVQSEDGWTEVAVEVPTGLPGAAFLQLELLVLQPEQLAATPAAPFTVWRQDYNGKAWFDDVTISQPPRTRMWTNEAGNIVPAERAPEIHMSVRDMTGERLSATLTVINARGETVATQQRNIDSNIADGVWAPPLTQHGWYRVRMDVLSGGNRVGGSFADLVWLGPDYSWEQKGSGPQAIRTLSEDRGRFGVMIDDLTPQSAGVVPRIIRLLGVGHATIPAWGQNGAGQAEVMQIVDAMLADWRDPTLFVPGVPTSGPQDDPSGDAWEMMLGDKAVWMPRLSGLLDRYGQRVRRWQIGPWQDSENVVWRPDAWKEARKIRETLAAMVAGPIVAVPTRADVAKAPPTPKGYSLIAVADSAAPPRGGEQFSALWENSGESDAMDYTIALPKLPADRFGMEVGPSELVKRLVGFWSAISRPDGTLRPAVRIAVEQPWLVTKGKTERVMPTPELSAMHTAMCMLADRRVVGRYPIADGVVCMILAPSANAPVGRGGALVAWNESAAAQDASLDAFLGQGPIRVVDIDGNSREAAWASVTEAGRGVHIPLTTKPVFIEGINNEFARFLAGFRVEPALLESNNKSHPREVVVENPWGQTITGRITILEPGGLESGERDRSWRLSPRVMNFSVPAKQTQRVPFTVAFSPSEEVGPKDFVFSVELAADEVYQPVQVRRRLEVGLADLGLELSYSLRGDRGQDLVIEAAVSNASMRTLTLDLTAFAPELPRVKTTIVDLVGGNSTVRRMTFPNALAGVRGQKVVVTVRDSASEARVTKSILVQ